MTANSATLRQDAVTAVRTGRKEPRRALTAPEWRVWREAYKQEQSRRVTAALQEARR